jgi:hypothetical protein
MPSLITPGLPSSNNSYLIGHIGRVEKPEYCDEYMLKKAKSCKNEHDRTNDHNDMRRLLLVLFANSLKGNEIFHIFVDIFSDLVNDIFNLVL